MLDPHMNEQQVENPGVEQYPPPQYPVLNGTTPVQNAPNPKNKTKILLIIVMFTVIILIFAGSLLFNGLNKKSNTAVSPSSSSVATSCSDKSCFEEHFKNCESAKYIDINTPYETSYQIIGTKEGSCSVKQQYLKSPSKAVLNKEMICGLDNELSFQEAIQVAKTYPKDYECNGNLIEYYDAQKLQKAPNDSE